MESGEWVESVGLQLQRARKQKQCSLAQVTAHTKIQPWVLEALESDRLPQLMSPIYVKGFLTTYAKFLHLDPEPLVAQWFSPPAAQAQDEPTSLPTDKNTTDATVAVGSLIVERWPQLAKVVLACATIVAVVVINPLRWIPKLSLTGQPFPKLASLSPLNPTHTASSEDIAKELKLSLRPMQPLELAISAKRTTWIRIMSDGKLIAQQRLSRGANEHWRAKERFEVIIAKPSQVELMLNDTSISPLLLAYQGRLVITHRGVTPLPEPE